jgi:serine phosphatase RsbU (regulator of sigma subunit)
MFLLRVRQPGHDETVVPMRGDQLTIGRSPACRLSFPQQKALSRTHARFALEGDGWTIEDLDSSNGTLLNGARLEGKRGLGAGDSVRMGEIELLFEPIKSASGLVGAEFESEGAVSPKTSFQYTNLHAILARSQGATIHGRPEGVRPISDALTALLKVGRELGAHQPLEQLFETILELASDAVGARRGLLMTVEGDALVVRASRGESFRISRSISQRVLKEKVSVVVADVAVDPKWELHQSIVSQGIRSLMAAPLQTDERVIGLIYLDSTGTSQPFSSADLDLLTVMANVAAMRIERERLALVEKEQQFLESELRQAAEIQRQCLPAQAPQVAGFTLAGFSQPCRTVGGDYYGFFERRDGRFCIVLGDVAGKGMAAALLMMNLQARVQILAEDADDPAVIAERLNRTLAPICPSNRFVTLFVMILDPRTGDLAFCNAGHEPALVVRARGEIEPLLDGGPVIGLFGDLRYERGDCRLESGDAVVLFTDGITEARGSGGDEFGTDRIGEVFRARNGASATEVLASLNAAVRTWLAGAQAHDDVTAVALVRET